jgi:ATP-binding cassette subfamily B protein
MWLIRLYLRVLGQLGSDIRIGAILAVANIGLAIAAFAEPILFGRIIDRLTGGGAATGVPLTFSSLVPLLAAWIGFGLFTIGAGVLVALNADKLSHRRRLATMATFFEHVLELPLAFHTSVHSGRVLKVMLEGANGMAWLWLGFFRDHFSALVALLILLPLTVFLNWQLGLLLVILVFVFTVLTALVLRKTETLQGPSRTIIRAWPSTPRTRSATCP